MNRAAPALNVYALGFPMTYLDSLVPDFHIWQHALVNDTLRHLNQYLVGSGRSTSR